MSNTIVIAILITMPITIARLLGEADYGLSPIALIISSLMILFVDFGINPALINFLAQSYH